MTRLTPPLASPYATSDFAPLRAAIVFAPTPELSHIAPLQSEPGSIAERAREQFGIFTGRLAAAGVRTIEAAGSALSPFGADGAVVFPDGAFLMRPSDVRGRGAMAALEAMLADAGIPIVGRIEAPGLLDGGDVLFSGTTLYLGVVATRQAETGMTFVTRGNALGRAQLAAYARTKNIAVVEVPMAAEIRRLRSVASFIDAKTIVVAPGLLDASVFAGLDRIDVPRGEDYAAGLLALGNRRVLGNLRFRETLPHLRASKVNVDAIDLWEFGKVGATPSSMVLALKRG